MDEYIKRDDALKIMKDAWMLYTSGDDAIQEAIDCISLLPAADVVERKKGKRNGELVKRLRSECALPYSAIKDMRDAADVIEELSVELLSDRAILKRYGGETGIKNLQEYANKYWDTLAKIPRWIPCSERLPKGADKSGELCENVWLLFDDGNVYPGWMNGITGKVYYLSNYSGSLMTAPKSRVKMWQPRPEPPKEG